MKFAQILQGKVHWIGEYDSPPDFHSNAGLFVEIEDEQIKEGWSYDMGVFIATPALDPITIISNTDLWDRFLVAEQESLVDSASKQIKRFLYELRIKTVVDLSAEKLVIAINALESAGIIGAGRATKILEAQDV